MAPSQLNRVQSWDSMLSSDTSQELQASVEDDMDMTQTQPRIRTIQDVHNAIHPLRATADRVGKEVEKFAESLDRLNNSKIDTDDCRRVLPIVRDYEKIATETVTRLRRYHEPERQERLKGKWRRKVEQTRTPTPSLRGRSSGAESGTTVEDLENWEQERQTWQLLRLILQSQFPAPDEVQVLPDQEAQYQRPAANSEINELSSEHEIWNDFLGKYTDVWEKHVIVEWLKSNAESNGPTIDAVIEELDEAADRGRGLSAHGWLYSKEAIKGQKRLRGWPQPLEPAAGTEVGLLNKDKTKRLVTQLDADAFSRQGRSIEIEDIFFERAAWLGCWEMMRRGESWQAIRSFCQERIEGWRALAIRGDPRSPESNRKGLDLYAGPRSRILWRKMCEKAAREGGIDDYENAVYGLLSGNLEAVEKVARSWDDYLFALYNSQILQQFDYFVQKSFPERLPETIDGSNDKLLLNSKPVILSPQATWESLLSHTKTKTEARAPIKMIQGSLIARLFEKYIHQQGLALGRSMSTGTQSKQILRGTSEEPMELGASADVTVEDYDILRIMTHIILIFMELKALKATSVATENIIFAYVSFLANAGKYELLPIYAAKLSEQASIELMARQLHLISSQTDQKTIMGLMKQYNLNTTAILSKHLLLLSNKMSTSSAGSMFPKLRLLDPVEPGSFDMPLVKRDFLSEELTSDQADLIHAVEWYLSVEGAWEETFWAGTLVYKYFLRNGAFHAAAMLANTIPYSLIAETKSRAILGFRSNLGPDWTSRGDADEDRTMEIMLRQSDSFRGLENMMWALTSLEKWTEAYEHIQINDPKAQDSKNRRDLQKAHEQLVVDVESLLNDWLECPESDEEKAELEQIRNTYLPEIILAYISAIYINGHKLSREIMPKIMNLAIDIAAHGSKVGESFQAAGRMTELMDFMAAGSLGVLRAEETMAKRKGGKVKKTKPGRRGENLDIWNVKVPGRET